MLESEALSTEPAEDTRWLSYSQLLRFHHLPLESMPRGARVERSMWLEHGRMRAVRWRASLADEEARRIRAIELAAGASSSRDVEIEGGTTDSVVADEDTTEGVQTT